MKSFFLGTVTLAAVFLSLPSFAQQQGTSGTACGARDARLDAESGPERHAMAQPESGKSVLYVIEDDGVWNRIPGSGVTFRVGMDGSWVGATDHHHPYVSLVVTPGEHHLCGNVQTRTNSLSKSDSLAHFEAEADKTYYFRMRLFGESEVFLDLDPIDSDQGRFLVERANGKTTSRK